MKTHYEAVASLMQMSTAMNSSGFVMQVKLFTVETAPDGKKATTILHGVQYQVLKFQKSKLPASDEETIVLYLSGSTGENPSKITVEKLAPSKRGGVVNAITKNLQNHLIKGTTMGYYATFFAVLNDADESKLDIDSKIKRKAALQLARSYGSIGGDIEQGYFKFRPSASEAFNSLKRNLMSPLSYEAAEAISNDSLSVEELPANVRTIPQRRLTNNALTKLKGQFPFRDNLALQVPLYNVSEMSLTHHDSFRLVSPIGVSIYRTDSQLNATASS